MAFAAADEPRGSSGPVGANAAGMAFAAADEPRGSSGSVGANAAGMAFAAADSDERADAAAKPARVASACMWWLRADKPVAVVDAVGIAAGPEGPPRAGVAGGCTDLLGTKAQAAQAAQEGAFGSASGSPRRNDAAGLEGAPQTRGAGPHYRSAVTALLVEGRACGGLAYIWTR
jgi:hypothetical protein